MGLLFICIGEESGKSRVVISRFPADEGVVAERSSDKLTVAFVEQVFLKSSHSYKAATYVSSGRPADLWAGHVIDKQINHGSKSRRRLLDRRLPQIGVFHDGSNRNQAARGSAEDCDDGHLRPNGEARDHLGRQPCRQHSAKGDDHWRLL
jgi:hypothetical protein